MLTPLLINSLRRRWNLTPVSNVCEAAPISLFRGPNGLNELPQMRFEFPFNLIGKSTVAFLTGQSWCALKSWFTGWGLKQRFQRCFADELNQRFGSVCGAGYRLRAQLLFTKTSYYDNSTILNLRNVISLLHGDTMIVRQPIGRVPNLREASISGEENWIELCKTELCFVCW